MDDNLVTMKKIINSLKSFAFISMFMDDKNRKSLKKDLEEGIHIEKTIQDYIRFFSDRGWCCYDSLSFNMVEQAVKEADENGIEAGEKVILKYYMKDVKDVIGRLKNKAKPFEARYKLIQKSFEEHFAGRYYSSIPLFLIIIDGAVNDYTKSKGFFAEGTDLSAWDCLVGCDDSLSKMKEIFNSKRTKTNTERITVPYRNGIMHGRDLNYDNEYVSCKSIALMFAIADWINLKGSEKTRKQEYDKKENKLSFLELCKKNNENRKEREKISKWKKREITIDKDISSTPSIEECADFPYLIPLIEAFNAWDKKNYGLLSKKFRKLFFLNLSETKCAGECRKTFESKQFVSFSILEIEERAVASTRILAKATWIADNKETTTELAFNSIYQDENERPASPWNNNGEWVLYPWKTQGLFLI